MTPPKISVHQVGGALPVPDGAADTMLAVKRALSELGFASEIFVDRIDGGWPMPVRSLSELRLGAQDLLLIHHWAFQDRLDRLAELRCRKALVYHGLTPPRYFLYGSREYHRSVKAYAQLANLRNICGGAIAVSGAAEELRRRGFARLASRPFAWDWSGLRSVAPVEPLDAAHLPGCRIVSTGAIAEVNHQREAVAFIDRCRSIGTLPLQLALVARGESDRRYRAAVEDDISRFGLGDRISVIDAAGPGELAGWCRAAYACLSLSDGEAAVTSTRAAMALDLPVVAYATPDVRERLGAAILIDRRDPIAIGDALRSLLADHSLRRRVIRRQREEVCIDHGDQVRHDLRQWLLAIGVYRPQGLVKRLIGWRLGADDRGRHSDEWVPSAAGANAPRSTIHYAIETELQFCREAADADPQIALALDQLPARTVSLKLIGDDASLAPGVAPPLRHLLPPAAAQAERIITIRRSCPPRLVGMLGDVRLIHLAEAESQIEPPLAALINVYLDGILVPSQAARRALRNSGVRLPVAVIGRGAGGPPMDLPLTAAAATAAARLAQSDAAPLPWRGVAETIDEFVLSLDNRPAMNRRIRLAWISTYNSRCGLATHSEHLLEHFDRDAFDITVVGNHQEPIKPDPANVVRLWPDRSGSLGSVRDFIGDFDVVFVNFHFSLIEINDLAATLQVAQRAGIDTHVTVHKTADTEIDGRIVSLRGIADALRLCTRVIVHTEADIARLEEFGVADNVVMIPPGVIDRPALSPSTVRSLLNLRQFHPIIGTFGFLLPPKGLQQLIHAFALVLRQFPDALLLMLNAEYPGAVDSAEERSRCRALISDLGLEDRIQLVDAFLETDEILLLLNACDLTVFTYQDSAESDSGAVRLGLAAGRPVATTPLPVFANLVGVVHRFSGTAVADIADGIVGLLHDPERGAAILRRQQDWISRNNWAAQAIRIGNLVRGCFEEGHGVELRPPLKAQSMPAAQAAEADGDAGGAAALREMLVLLQPGDPVVEPPPQAAEIADWPVRQAR